MFTTFVVQPIFNLLVAIYALLPGHNFGVAIILFTIVIRLLMWPLVKKQLHHTKAMRAMQPDLKRIKKAAKGDRQKESQMMMELYKERGINPFSAFPTLIVQFMVLIGLFIGLKKVIHDPENLVSFAYPFLQDLSWLKELAHDVHSFDNTLFGVIDLSKAALSDKGVYVPGMLIAIASAIVQYFQSMQLMPVQKDARTLRQILKDASEGGDQPDQSETTAAMMRSMRYVLPGIVLVGTVQFPAALGLYWLVGGVVAYIQQSIALREDGTELEAMADKPAGKDTDAIPEAEIVETKQYAPKPKKKKSSNAKKRRK